MCKGENENQSKIRRTKIKNKRYKQLNILGKEKVCPHTAQIKRKEGQYRRNHGSNFMNILSFNFLNEMFPKLLHFILSQKLI